MKRYFLLALLSFVAVSVFAQSKPVTFLTNPGDGSIVVRTTANGRNRVLARETAAKLAIRTVVFDGVFVPAEEAMSKPLITELKAKEKYEDFFNDFFSESGPYKNFYSIRKDRKFISNNVEVKKTHAQSQVTVRVERAKLKSYLKEQGILR